MTTLPFQADLPQGTIEKDAASVPVSWLDRPVIRQLPGIKVETLIVAAIILVAIFSRFYILGDRVMSHDETNHVVPSFDLFQGRGYRHDPVTHGPFQFHIIALTFFLLGDNDFTARIPAAIFSIATVVFAWWGFRRYLGRTGALVAATLILISPYMLFYGRYTRNEAFIGLQGLVLIYATLRYLEEGKTRYLFLLSLALVFHFIVKETAYIYTAQLLLFLGFLTVYRLVGRPWRKPGNKRTFLLALGAGIIFLGAAMAVQSATKVALPEATPTIASPAVPNQPPPPPSTTPLTPLPLILGGVALVDLLAGMYFLIDGVSLAAIRRERAFDLLLLTGTLVLPLLAPFPIKLVGWDPLDYSSTGILHTAIMLIPIAVIAVLVGIWWRPRIWLTNAALFYTVFVVFYTTFFTNGSGFMTGLIGGLGYWLSQQSVHRGEQPLYYFALIQIPIYEFLPAIGAILAFILALRHRNLSAIPAQRLPSDAELDRTSEPYDDGSPDDSALKSPEDELALDRLATEADVHVTPAANSNGGIAAIPDAVPFVFLLLFWSVTSLIAYTVAGEKMPWLTVHITWPMILASGWSIGYLLDTTPWKRLYEKKGLLAVILLPVFLFSLAGTLASLLGSQPPFQGNDLAQLQNSATFLTAFILAIASGIGLLWWMRGWSAFEIGRWVGVVVLVTLVVLTARTAIRASYINYDNAKEYLVYAHAASGPKQVLQEVTDISQRTTGGLDIAVAYGGDALYPYWWYFRDFPKKYWYAEKITRELRNYPIIIVDDKSYGKIEAVVGQAYTYYEVTRLWWPNQDYFNLTWDRLKYALTNPQMRSAIWQIWLNRDYSQFAQITNNTHLTLTNWDPSNKMRVYIRKDIVSQIWKYGVAPTSPVVAADPYEKGTTTLTADALIGSAGDQPGQFNAPRGVAIAPDGSLYVADSKNNRIQRFKPDGTPIQAWGTFADASKGEAPGGTFNEPWGVAVGPDGSVYVADTWNNRIQKFNADGKFVKMWGYFGQAEKPEAFWGPRGLAVTSKGQLLVTDTGNKRVVVFDSDGNYVTQFGGAGAEPGGFDEPVGIAINSQGQVIVADTWNQRVQVFTPDGAGVNYTPTTQWDVSAWYGQSLDNKPFLAVDAQGNVFVADPEGYRVIEFDGQGKFIRTWGDNTTDPTGFGVVAGIAVDASGDPWVADAGNMRIMHFPMPK
ncbi:MAG: TIGR03663 family protein [Anaerolineaceae bacterium]|nr:TIGR03663 family protein [Anaerolineaceae bacterium]